MRSKKILIVSSEFPPLPGGIGTHAFGLAQALTNNKHNVKVISDQRDKNQSSEVIFDAQHKFKVYRVSLKKPRFIMYLNRIRLLIKHCQKVEYVFSSGKFSLWSVALMSIFFNVKCIAIVHGTEVNFKNTLLNYSIKSALKKYSKIIAVSHYTKSLLTNLHYKTEVIPNGININNWDYRSIQCLKLKDSPNFMTVGRISERKGQAIFVKHIPKLLKNYPNLIYHCIGIPQDANSLLEIADGIGVKQHIKIHGVIEENLLKRWLISSDIFIMLSKETDSGDVEGFGIAILEANALGIPVVGSFGSGIEDAIDNGKTGFLIDGNNFDQLESAVKCILNDYESFSNNAIEWAEKHSWQRLINNYEQLLQ